MVNAAAKIARYYVAGQLLTIDASGRKLSYLHQDRLGSNVAISEKPMTSTGQLGTSVPVIVEHRGFDAFGKALDGGWGTSNLGMLNLSGGALFNQGKRNQRGFTGHEHLDEFALIHMNGRAYDFNLGRFLGVDPFVQFPSNSQSLNPYGYLMNNPSAGTDPTGYAVNCSGEGDNETCTLSQVREMHLYENKKTGEVFVTATDDEGNSIEVKTVTTNGANPKSYDFSSEALTKANEEVVAMTWFCHCVRADKPIWPGALAAVHIKQ